CKVAPPCFQRHFVSPHRHDCRADHETLRVLVPQLLSGLNSTKYMMLSIDRTCDRCRQPARLKNDAWNRRCSQSPHQSTPHLRRLGFRSTICCHAILPLGNL
ncbi:unnamed protein product, partial [Ectocarpus sp. 8 AP-2014]